LAYAREHDGTFTSRAYQKLAGVDMYGASRDIKDLMRKGIVCLRQKGGRVYELCLSDARPEPERPAEYTALEPILKQQGFVTNKDIRAILGVSAQRANRIAGRLEEWGWLRREGAKRGTRYLPTRV
jgi:Fic family protein